MSINTFLDRIEALLQHGNATEHSYHIALKTLFESVIPGATATNEPKRKHGSAPDFELLVKNIPIGYVEAKAPLTVDIGKVVTESDRDAPKHNAEQLKRYRALLSNLLYTDGLIWYWFVEGELRTAVPVQIAIWDRGKKKLRRSKTADADLTKLLSQFADHQALLIGTPHDLARRLAQVARWLADDINMALKEESDQGTLHQQLEAFKQTLLPNITHKEFADMYAQTIVYGLFAARVANPDRTNFSRADVVLAIPKTNPFLRKLFYSIAGNELDTRIAWLVDHCADLLTRTDMAEVLRDFGKATKQEDPVVHFYETFLAAYDPKTRERRGVYYTPEPVVSYIVRSVDRLLDTHFGKRKGLADGDTIILDPATGTATFLHAVVQYIYQRLDAIGDTDHWNQYVPKNLLPRLFGFELLMAPYTIAHLKLSLLLQQRGYDFTQEEQIGVYLTNALLAHSEEQESIPFKDLMGNERQDARDVQQDKPVMVVLGNPPYANYGMSNKGDWINGLLHDYKKGLHEKKLNLDDDCIKFIRFGQWHIEQNGQGIMAFITNNTYLDGITHRRMRESLLETFTDIYILNLHGSSLKKEVCPDGSPDENVFDIQQGVAFGIFIKESGKTESARVHHAELWGKRATKYPYLANNDVSTTNWTTLRPEAEWFFFVPKNLTRVNEFSAYHKITELFMVQQNVIKTDRDSLFVDPDKNTLSHRIETFYSDAGLDASFRTTYRVENSSSYELLSKRQKTSFDLAHMHPLLYRPFDVQWIYYAIGITSRPAWDVMRHMLAGTNIALLGMRQYEYAVADYCYVLVTEHITESRIFISNRGGASMFPLYLYPTEQEIERGIYAADERRPNFSDDFIKDIETRLTLTFIPDGSGDLDSTIGPEDLFHYIYAVLHIPTYRTRYAEFLKIDFPRIPITSDTVLFKTLVAYGATLVDLHLLRTSRETGQVGGAGGAEILRNPKAHGVTQHTTTAGYIEKITYDATQQRVIIGTDMYFEGIAPNVWSMQIGGYQPLQKWLKDRKGRTLSFEESLHYMQMIIALRETRRIMKEIDAAIPSFPLE